MLEISIKALEKSYNVTPVLDEVTFDVKKGDRIGIIGRNGSGKTTLFKVLMGKEPYNNGKITFRKHMKLGYLDQIPEYEDSIKVESVIKEALSDLIEIQAQMALLEGEMGRVTGTSLEEVMRKYTHLNASFESIGGYERFVDEQKLIEGFGFDEDFLKRPFYQLSGGEKTRVMLAQLILSNPDVLLLDEPSNHLDTHALEWLESYILKYSGAVVSISHDRHYLDNVVNKIIEIEDRVAQVYHGNYTYYKAEKERRMLLWMKDYNNQQKQFKAMQEAIDRFRAWSSCGQDKAMIAKIKNMEKRMERIEKIDKPITSRKQMQIKFSAKERSGNEVIRLSDLSHGFGERLLFEKVDALIHYKDIFALMGKNGCGKSTLLKIILGEIQAMAGEVRIGSRVKLAYLDQNVVLGDESLSVLELYRSYYPCKEGIARSVLARSLFMGEDLAKIVSTLSGGEKMRLKLCILMQEEVNLLILDEPTNHLDIEAREMLESTLGQFEGTIVFVSHDRYFVKKLATRVGEMTQGRLRLYEGDYNYYQEKKAQAHVQEKVISKPVKAKSSPQKQDLDTALEVLELKLTKVERKMKAHVADYVKLESLAIEKEHIEWELEQLLG